MTAAVAIEAGALRLYDAGLRAAEAGLPALVEVCDERGRARPMPLRSWCAERLPGDHALLDRCTGPTLDVGCGPGRLTAALTKRGVPALGIDISAAAVELTRNRGGAALRTSVFGPVPAETHWGTVLLADGNIGIGGDPLALLRRAVTLLAPGGRIVLELDPAATTGVQRLHLRWHADRSDFFDWASVCPGDLVELALRAGLTCRDATIEEGRWFGVLELG